MSTFSPINPYLEDDDEPELDLDGLEDDDVDVSASNVSRGGKNSSYPSSVITSASSRPFATPASSLLSLPSGLPIETIARLTHDELRHNAEFMKYVGMVDSLQELLSFRQTTATHASTPASSGGSSLRPSESASQISRGAVELALPLPLPRPVARPSCYPPSVLWTLEDCRSDPTAGVSATNASRPPMRRVIRDETGEMISPAEWKSIRKSAAVVFATHLEVLPISRLLAPGRPCKKNFYKRHFAKEWNRAIKALESVAPLLSLCSGTWKADLTLGSVLPGDRPSDASLAAANSRASTPSSVAPSSRILPSNLSRSSHLAPPSSVVSSHAASPSRSSSLVSRAPPLSPRRVSFKSSRPPLPTQSPVPSGPVQRQPASKAVGPKPKRARDQSPASRSKRSRANSAVSDRRRPPSPRPAFLSLVKGGSQSEPPPSQPRPSPSPSPEPAPKATRSKGKASRVKAASTRSTQGNRRTTTDDDDAAAQPPLAPLSGEDAAGKDASGEEAASGSTEGSGDDEDEVHIGLLQRDELVAWAEEHNIELQKRATKKDIIKTIAEAPKAEQPSKEDIEGIVHERKSKRNGKAA